MDNQSGSDFLSSNLTRTLSLDIARVTEAAAVAAAHLRGRGDERRPTLQRLRRCGGK